VALSAAPPADKQDALLVEWADHALDPEAIIGDPIYMRTLYCTPQEAFCQLTVITIGRPMHEEPGRPGCPLFISTETFTTEAGQLRVLRTGDNLDLHVPNGPVTLRLRLNLMTSSAGPKIVKQASGELVSNPLDEERYSTKKLVAFVQDEPDEKTPPGASPETRKLLEHLRKSRHFVQVEMKCSKISVVATKEAAK